MKIIINEKQLKSLKEDSETLTTLSNLTTTADAWQNDLGGKYLKRYKKNKNDYVKRVQTMLTLLGYDVGHYGDGKPAIDGLYGPDTAEGVREYQKEIFNEPIEWDGIVGPKTYTELLSDIEELADEHLMSVEEVLVLGLEDENIMGVEDDVHYDEEDDDEDTGGEILVNDEDELMKIGKTIAKKASERLGETYIWGGEFDGVGGDCSGLVDWTFRNIDGLESPGRDTTRSLLRNPNFISGKSNYSDAKVGDILLFNGKKAKHTGIVSDVSGSKISMVHSAGSGWDEGTKRGVQITNDVFNDYNYFRNNYLGYIPFESFMVDNDDKMS